MTWALALLLTIICEPDGSGAIICTEITPSQFDTRNPDFWKPKPEETKAPETDVDAILRDLYNSD